jgi:hypothetical protein
VDFKKQLIRVIVIIFFSVLVVVYWRYDPAERKYFPQCPFYYLTGYKCVGCGSQRAIHKLLNLDFQGALKDNFLMVLSIPYLLIGFVFDSLKKPNMEILKWRKTLFGSKAICLILIILISFWILRNVPVFQNYI